MSDLKGDICRAMVDVVGRGYVPAYYESLASEIVQIAEWHIEDAVKADRKARASKAAAKARKRKAKKGAL